MAWEPIVIIKQFQFQEEIQQFSNIRAPISLSTPSVKLLYSRLIYVIEIETIYRYISDEICCTLFVSVASFISSSCWWAQMDSTISTENFKS
jgi:hypothetical protein